MEEKSIEELQAELEALRKENLAAKIAEEKAKAEERQRLEKEQKLDELREELREEILDQVTAESKITSNDEPTKLDAPTGDLEEFKSVFTKKLGITGEPYESYIKKLAYKEYTK